MFGGLVRPGVSFGPGDWRRAARAEPIELPRPLAALERFAIYCAMLALFLLLATGAVFLFGVVCAVIQG